jgi:hypothetical protein
VTDKDYIDKKGYWIDPERNVRRMSDDGGEQRIIIRATEACSDAEWARFYEAIVACIQLNSEGPTEQEEGGEGN